MLVEKNLTGVEVLGRYASNGDVAASLSRFGEGVLANTGPHPEADGSWCEFAHPDLAEEGWSLLTCD